MIPLGKKEDFILYTHFMHTRIVGPTKNKCSQEMDAPSSLKKNKKASVTAGVPSATCGTHISACVCVVSKVPGKMLCTQEVLKKRTFDFTCKRTLFYRTCF